MHPQPQGKVARAYRIEGSIVLDRSAAGTLSKVKNSLHPAQPWWFVVFSVPLFLRTLIRLLIACPHRHKGPPMSLRESVPSNLPGCRSVYGRGTYITCLDCGQKFAYNHKTRRMEDFWGIHDAEALAGVRRKVGGLFSPLRGLAASAGRLKLSTGNSMRELVRSVHRLGVSTKGSRR